MLNIIVTIINMYGEEEDVKFEPFKPILPTDVNMQAAKAVATCNRLHRPVKAVRVEGYRKDLRHPNRIVGICRSLDPDEYKISPNMQENNMTAWFEEVI